MKHLPIFCLAVSILFFFFGCGRLEKGESAVFAPDSVRTSPAKVLPPSAFYTGKERLLTPYDYRKLLYLDATPFHPAFLRTHDVTALEIRAYSELDNPRLKYATSEKGLEISTRTRFRLRPDGTVSEKIYEAYRNGEPDLKYTYQWRYDDANRPIEKFVLKEWYLSTGTETMLQDTVQFHYDSHGRLVEINGKEFGDYRMVYDDVNGFAYEGYIDDRGFCRFVTVFGAKGAFSEEVCKRIARQQFEFHRRKHPRGHNVSRLDEVSFVEHTGNTLLSETVVDRTYDYWVFRSYVYDSLGRCVEIRYPSSHSDPDSLRRKQMAYLPNGDEVESRSEFFDQGYHNTITTIYVYGSDGFLLRELDLEKTHQTTPMEYTFTGGNATFYSFYGKDSVILGKEN